MNIEPKTVTTITEAQRDFSKVAAVAKSYGKAVISEGDKPKFILIDAESAQYFDVTDDERIDIAAARVLKRFRPAFEELAK